MTTSQDRRVDSTHRLFTAFARGDFDAFLGGCEDGLVLTVRGSDPMTTLVPKADIPEWYRSMRQLAGRAFQASVSLVLADERVTIVVVGFTVIRQGCAHHYETVNHCTFRDGLLATWFARPLQTSAYSRAWGLPAESARLPA